MDRSIDALAAQNVHLLGQLEQLLGTLPVAVYRSRPARHGSTIGAQTRHVLDHYDRLLARDSDAVDYASRERDGRTETDPERAATRVARIRQGLRDLRNENQALRIRDSAATPEEGLASSLARELAFLASHTVHHLALIALLAEWQGEPPPEHFGVAPSTLEHRQGQSIGA
ncbi:DinB family protein [Sediminicurvatus halobius]|uniref:DinB-like domain-containing protein n=1 Tax=Sediminicurvatus halobius TaxID=2182432 RepID=A0A2U2N289_9GAMM|nr:DinB family protein [Spiribacter halobius]PWG63084.1 hypothetical protein DEM34_09530 [Spiribacter halobius]UEX77532.1 DinB family protein [Spiribacter halobius]